MPLEPFQHAGQSWDCSQVVYELEERGVMDCIWDETNEKRSAKMRTYLNVKEE